MVLLRSIVTIGGMTMVSRVLGFIRDMLIAAVLGAGPVADAFFVAFRLPNLFRALFAEGAFSAAFVPLFAKQVEAEGEAKAVAFAEQAFSVLLSALLLFLIAFELGDAALHLRHRPGLRRSAGAGGAGGRAGADHLPLPAVHLAGVAAWAGS